MRIWTPSNTCFLEPTRVHDTNGISIGLAVFAQLLFSPYTSQHEPLSTKIARSHRGISTPFNTRFLEPIQAHNPHGILIGAAVFAEINTVTDRQTTILGR